MKKICLLLIVLILLLTSCSCSRKVNEYNIDTITDYFDEVYNIINDEDLKYVAIDLRNKKAYEELHIRQFQNYDLEKGRITELISWLFNTYSKKHHVIIYTENLLEEEFITELTEHYYNIYICTANFEDIKLQATEYFVLDTGEYDCGC